MGRAEAERRGDGKRDDDSGMFRAEFEMPTAASTRVKPLAWAGPTSVSPTLIRDDVAGAKKHGVTEARRMPSSWVRDRLFVEECIERAFGHRPFQGPSDKSVFPCGRWKRPVVSLAITDAFQRRVVVRAQSNRRSNLPCGKLRFR